MSAKEFNRGIGITVLKMIGLAVLAVPLMVLVSLIRADEYVLYINGGIMGAMIFSMGLQIVYFNRQYTVPYLRQGFLRRKPPVNVES